MKINKVFFENFKNKQGVTGLTGADIFIGKNGTGKSSIIEGIQLSISDKLVNCAKARDVFSRCSNDTKMEVGLGTDNNFKVCRTFNKSLVKHRDLSTEFKYAEKAQAQVDGTKVTGVKAVNESIVKSFGNQQVSFDFGKFLEMSDTEKKNFILSFSNSISFDDSKIKDFILKEKEDLDDVLLDEAISYILSDIEEDKIQEKAEEMLMKAKEQLSYYRKLQTAQTSTIQKLNERKTSCVDSKGLALDKKKLDKLNETIVKETAELSALKEKNKQIEKNIENIKIFNKKIEELKAEPKKDNKELLSGLEKNKENLVKVIAEGESISKNITIISEEYSNLQKQLKDAENKLSEIKTEGAAKKAETNMIIGLVTQVKNVKGKCAINACIPCNADFSKWLEEKSEEIKNKKNTLTELVKECKAQQSIVTKLQESTQKKSSEREILIKQHQQIASNINALNSAIRSKESQLEAMKKEQAIKSEKIKNLSENLEKLQKEDNKIVPTEEKENKINELKEEIATLKTTIDAKETSNHIKEEIKAAKEELKKTDTLFDIYKYLVNRLGQKGLQGEIFKTLVSPIEKTVNEVLSKMNINRKFIIKEDSDALVFGYENGDSIIDFEALSTGQQALLGAALAISFIEKSELPIKIFCIDNIENLDKDNIKNLLDGLGTLYGEKALDNIIVCGCLEPSIKGIIPSVFKINEL